MINKKIIKIVLVTGLVGMLSTGFYCVESSTIKRNSLTFASGCDANIPYSTPVGFHWKSSDSDIASVNADGKVVGKSKGKATITAELLWKKETCTVTITNPELSSKYEKIPLNGSVDLKMQGTPSDVKWESSDTSVVLVDDGKLIAKDPGKATVTASVDGITKECSVTVPVPTVDSELKELKKGEKEELKLINPPSDEDVIWSVSDYNIADIKDGKLIGKNVGKVQLMAKAGEREYSEEITVTGDQKMSIDDAKTRVSKEVVLKINNLVDSYSVKWDGAEENPDGTATFVKDKEGEYEVSAVVDTGVGKEKLTAVVVVHDKHLNITEWSGQIADTFDLVMEKGENVTYEYDEEYLSNNGSTFRALKAGQTSVTVKDEDTELTCDVNIEASPEMEGSSLGQSVVAYALQFVGNPYVYGGSSLTNGTDCSGFTMRIFEHFGISLPHSSSSQRSCGTAVDGLENARAGDIICYDGHVALYMGDGRIVHASTRKTGIKISNRADYRKIVAIRRLF